MDKVVWSDQALEDIDDIARRISKYSFYYAQLQVDKFFERAKILENQPYSGRIVPEINVNSIRELVMKDYRIIYEVGNNDFVTIITVHFSKKPLAGNPNAPF